MDTNFNYIRTSVIHHYVDNEEKGKKENIKKEKSRKKI